MTELSPAHIAALLSAGFLETTYPGQDGVFYKKISKACDLPYVNELLVGDSTSIDASDLFFVGVIPNGMVQYGCEDADYFEEPVSHDSEDGRGILASTGANLRTQSKDAE